MDKGAIKTEVDHMIIGSLCNADVKSYHSFKA